MVVLSLSVLTDFWPLVFAMSFIRWRGNYREFPKRFVMIWIIFAIIRLAKNLIFPDSASLLLPEPLNSILFVTTGAILAILAFWIRNSQIKKQGSSLKTIQQQAGNRDITHLVSLAPREFEEAIAALFQQKGYKVTHTGKSNDRGVDLRVQKDNIKAIVQCKRYTDKAIGSPDLQKFYGAIVDSGAGHGYFVTTSRFTSPAVQYVADKPITLLDRDGIIQWIQQSNQ